MMRRNIERNTLTLLLALVAMAITPFLSAQTRATQQLDGWLTQLQNELQKESPSRVRVNTLKNEIANAVNNLNKFGSTKAAEYQAEYDAIVSGRAVTPAATPATQLTAAEKITAAGEALTSSASTIEIPDEEEISQSTATVSAADAENARLAKHWKKAVKEQFAKLRANRKDTQAQELARVWIQQELARYSPELAAKYQQKLDNIIAKHSAAIAAERDAARVQRAEDDLNDNFGKLKSQLQRERPNQTIVGSIKRTIESRISELSEAGFADKAAEYQKQYNAILSDAGQAESTVKSKEQLLEEDLTRTLGQLKTQLQRANPTQVLVRAHKEKIENGIKQLRDTGSDKADEYQSQYEAIVASK